MSRLMSIVKKLPWRKSNWINKLGPKPVYGQFGGNEHILPLPGIETRFFVHPSRGLFSTITTLTLSPPVEESGRVVWQHRYILTRTDSTWRTATHLRVSVSWRVPTHSLDIQQYRLVCLMVQRWRRANGTCQWVDTEVPIRVTGVDGVPHGTSGPWNKTHFVFKEEPVSHDEVPDLLSDM
jgi:hypothetical protein